MSETHVEQSFSIHRTEALADGIYAVAMTLLVIELKLPDASHLHSSAEVTQAVVDLWPKFYAWILSFFVLAIFWAAHHRSHNHVRRADGALIFFTIVQLAFVSLMPFSSAMLGEHAGLFPQCFYSFNMAMLAVFSLFSTRHIHAHPELTVTPMTRGAYNGARIRIGGLLVIAAATVVIQWIMGDGYYGSANVAFALMAVIVPLSRRAERVDAVKAGA
jgi:uncharacterized membrane protein